MSNLHDWTGLTSKQIKIYRNWRACHHGKRRFGSRWQAWQTIAKIAVRERRIDWELHPYECRWMSDWTKGKTGPSHIHIGHSKKYRSPPKKAWYWLHRLVIWPYYRARSRYRKMRKSLW